MEGKGERETGQRKIEKERRSKRSVVQLLSCVI